jgi:hypothetical protein
MESVIRKSRWGDTGTIENSYEYRLKELEALYADAPPPPEAKTWHDHLIADELGR